MKDETTRAAPAGQMLPGKVATKAKDFMMGAVEKIPLTSSLGKDKVPMNLGVSETLKKMEKNAIDRFERGATLIKHIPESTSSVAGSTRRFFRSGGADAGVSKARSDVAYASPINSEANSLLEQEAFEGYGSTVVNNKKQEKEPDSLQNRSTITLGPTSEFFTADATIFFVVTLVLASVPTTLKWNMLLRNSIPWIVVLPWMLVSFALAHFLDYWKRVELLQSTEKSVPHSETADLPPGQEQRQAATHQEGTHRILLKVFGTSKIGFHSTVKSKGRRVFSTLTMGRVPLPWEHSMDPTKDEGSNSNLMTHLLLNPKLTRRRKAAPSRKSELGKPEQEDFRTSIWGDISLPTEGLDSLDEFVVVPVLKLRGMDIFLTDQAESEMSTHPYLIQKGLRDHPMLVLNGLTHFANLIVYFELPGWVTSWDNIVELEDDPPETIALKRFLKGDDAYRDARLKIVPSLVDAPLPVKMMAPPKEERTVKNTMVENTWQKHEAAVDANGRKLCPALELELDLLSSKAIRMITGIVRNNLQRVSLDLACIVSKPEGQEEDEPQACLALWRFDHIDMRKCPPLPARYDVNAMEADVMRASKIMSMTSDELTALNAEDV